MLRIAGNPTLAWITRTIALAIVLAACTSTPSDDPGYPLPTANGGFTCFGVPVASLILHGKLVSGTAEVWANDDVPIRWPPGYRARFDPSLVIVDATGTVRGREGEEMMTADPWHGQLVCPEHQNVAGESGALIVSIGLLNPPPPTPEGSRPCSAVIADLTSALPILRTDLAAMVGGATDGATRNQLSNDGARTLDLLERHSDCYPDARLTVWRADLEYLAHAWLPNFTHVEASRRLDELQRTPLG